MQFESWTAFFAMGGHGFYVWLAYGATFLVLLISYVSVRASRKRLVEAFKWAPGEAQGEAQGEEQGKTKGAAQRGDPAISEEEDIKL